MKTRKQVIGIAFVILAVYNIVAFVMPAVKNTTFWVAYGFSNLSIIIASLVILGALDETGIKNKFHQMPIVLVAWSYLIIQIVMGMVEIYYPINFRYSILINVILLGLSIISLVIVTTGKKEIDRVEEKVQKKVFFIQELQSDIETLADKTEEEQSKKELKELIETIRYSDPMSHSQLATIENQIHNKVQNLIQNAKDTEQVKQNCNELQQLFAERNRKAKLYKNQPEVEINPQKPLNFKAIVAVIVIVLVLIGIGVTLYFTVIIPNKQYEEAMEWYHNKQYKQAQMAFAKLEDYKDSQEKQKEVMYFYAIELMEKENYDQAIEELEKLGDYKDSKEQKNKIGYQKATEWYQQKNYSKAAEEFMKLEDYKDAKEKVLEIYNLFGEKDVIYFGNYKGEPIAWQILDTRDHKVLLITKDPIEEMAYHTEYKAIEWENSNIRKWLNEEFYNSFDEKEKQRMLKNTTETDDIFLLSDKNIKSYTKLRNTNTSWWIASSGNEKTKAMYVEKNGTIQKNGDIVTKLHGVRPSIWLNLD